MAETLGLNHLGLSVRDLDETTAFFVNVLGWDELARDESYPRNAVTDGVTRLTLWQVDHANPVQAFDRRQNVGLHHLALTVESEEKLNALALAVAAYPGAQIEFVPELMGTGPRKHFIFREPGGLRLELVWAGE